MEKMRSLEEAYHLALRIEEGKLKRKHMRKQQDERENEILLNVVEESANCTNKVYVVEESNEGSVYEMHVENSMLRESAKEGFEIERLR